MKMKKFLLCMTAAICVASTVSINAFAAEVKTVEQAGDLETTDVVVIDTNPQAEETTTEDSTITEEKTETEESTDTENKETESKETESETTTDSKKTTSDSKKETTKTSTTKKKTTSTTKVEASYSKAELRLLSALIYCEANSQSYAGKLAVGIVVVNRMESKAFPSTLKGVIYQKSQFGPVRNGSLNKALAEYDNNKFTSTQEKECIKAAKAALSGTKTITYTKNGKSVSKNLSGYYYFSGRLSNPRFTLGGHQFK
ncbi:cell wall hydrolase [Anaerosporobacter sp.]|uniref:cell wall hydrolase n=1 Tax=Anaerosporobacter sp. TaxID=1872529 RepID=UPI00286F49BD|nr:cell wall hydrolase [Anaerosporobacter sp.]